VNWQAIGAIGELAGGILVVFSLLYLAIQLRQNTRAVRAETHQQWVLMNSAQNLLFPQLPAFAAVFLRGSADPAQLSPEERVQYDALVLNVMNTQEALFFQAQHGAIDKEFLGGREPALLAVLRNPGFRRWWERNASTMLDPRFVAYVTKLLERQG